MKIVLLHVWISPPSIHEKFYASYFGFVCVCVCGLRGGTCLCLMWCPPTWKLEIKMEYRRVNMHTVHSMRDHVRDSKCLLAGLRESTSIRCDGVRRCGLIASICLVMKKTHDLVTGHSVGGPMIEFHSDVQDSDGSAVAGGSQSRLL
jgi:hypothetical protein